MHVGIDTKTNKISIVTNRRDIIASNFSHATILEVNNLDLPPGAYIYDPQTNSLKIDPNWTPPPEAPPSAQMTLGQQKTVKLYELTNYVTSHIQSQYPELKQRSDVADKEYYGSWLVTNAVDTNGNPAYTTDTLYQKAFVYGQQIWFGSKTLQQILTDIQTNELPNLNPAGTYGAPRSSWEQEFLFAWEQLIKIAVRVAFVQACKNVYRQVKSQIEQAQTLQELSSISMPALPNLPQEFR